MKGVVFNCFEDVVTRTDGPEAWDDLLDAAGVGGAYTSLGNYSDAELLALVGARSDATGVHPDEVVRGLGRAMIPAFAARYPELFAPHSGTRSLVLDLNEIVHPEVRKLYPGADVPTFGFPGDAGGTLVLTYASARMLCPLAEGLIAGTGDFFGEQVAITQPLCQRRGDDHCRLEIEVT